MLKKSFSGHGRRALMRHGKIDLLFIASVLIPSPPELIKK